MNITEANLKELLFCAKRADQYADVAYNDPNKIAAFTELRNIVAKVEAPICPDCQRLVSVCNQDDQC